MEFRLSSYKKKIKKGIYLSVTLFVFSSQPIKTNARKGSVLPGGKSNNEEDAAAGSARQTHEMPTPNAGQTHGTPISSHQP